MPLRGELIIAGLTLCAVGAAQPPTNAPMQNVDSETHTWTGTLVDATRINCGPEVERAAPAGACPVSVRTTNFGIILSDGKSLRFDEGGNAKAVDALRKSRKGSKSVFNYWKTGKTSNVVKARVTGTLTSDTLNVEAIKID
jgi:hypothetical protein